jgi:methionine synthase II (cobalamin-independent)
MLYSTERIMTTHAGSLPRSADLRDMVVAKANGQAHDNAALAAPLKAAVADVVRRQAKCANDGELSKTNFTDYVRWRMAGYVERPSAGPRRLSITAHDETKFAEYFTANPPARPLGPPTMPVVVEPLRYTGRARSPPTRQFQGRTRRRQCRRGVSLGQLAGHDRTLADKPIL